MKKTTGLTLAILALFWNAPVVAQEPSESELELLDELEELDEELEEEQLEQYEEIQGIQQDFLFFPPEYTEPYLEEPDYVESFDEDVDDEDEE